MTKILIIILTFTAIFLHSSCTKNTQETGKQRVGISPLQNVFLIENHNEALIKYKKSSVKNAILVHFDTHIDMNWIRTDELDLFINEKNIQKIQSYLKSPDQFYIPGKKFIHVGNWIFPLLMDSTFKEFYWVVPDKEILNSRWLNLFKKGIKLFQDEITVDEVASFKMNNALRRIEGRMYGKPINICTIHDLPEFSAPVVLDIDTDYFNFNSALYLERIDIPVLWPEEFLSLLAKKEIKSNLVTISYSVNDGYLSPGLRFFAEELYRHIKTGIDFSETDKNLSQLHKTVYLALVNKNPKQIHSDLKNILQQYPNDAALHYLISQIYALKGNRKTGIENLKIAAHLDNQYKYALLHKANALFYDRKYVPALRIYEAMNKKDLAQKKFVRYRIAECNKILGKIKQAEKIFKALSQQDPQNISLYEELGNLYLRLNKIEQSEIFLKKGLALDPFNRDLNFSLGLVYLENNKLDKANSRFKNCLKFYKNYEPAYFQLAKIAEQQNNPQQARKYYEMASH